MGTLIITITMPNAPKSVLNMMKKALEITFKEQMKKQGIAPENVTVEVED